MMIVMSTPLHQNGAAQLAMALEMTEPSVLNGLRRLL